MIEILNIVLPVFLVIGLGYAVTKRGLFTETHIDGINKFAQGIAIPLLLFLGISEVDLSKLSWPLYLTYYGPGTVVFALSTIGAILIFGKDKEDAIAIGFTALFGNTVLIGLPIMERAFGTESLQFNYALIAAHAPYCYLLGIVTMETASGTGANISQILRDIFKKIFSNVLMIAILFGLATNILGLTVSGAPREAMDLVVRAGLPAALFALGGVLARYRIKDTLSETIYVMVISLVLFPLLVWCTGLMFFEPNAQALKTAVITAALSCGVNGFIFASIYDRAKGVAATSIVLTTGISVVTISLWLLFLG